MALRLCGCVLRIRVFCATVLAPIPSRADCLSLVESALSLAPSKPIRDPSGSCSPVIWQITFTASASGDVHAVSVAGRVMVRCRARVIVGLLACCLVRCRKCRLTFHARLSGLWARVLSVACGVERIGLSFSSVAMLSRCPFAGDSSHEDSTHHRLAFRSCSAGRGAADRGRDVRRGHSRHRHLQLRAARKEASCGFAIRIVCLSKSRASSLLQSRALALFCVACSPLAACRVASTWVSSESRICLPLRSSRAPCDGCCSGACRAQHKKDRKAVKHHHRAALHAHGTSSSFAFCVPRGLSCSL